MADITAGFIRNQEFSVPLGDAPDDIESVARPIVHDWMAHLGYTPEQIALSDAPRVHGKDGDRCSPTEHGWECWDQNGDPAHPEHDEADRTAEFVMFVLEHPVLAGRLLPDGKEPAR